jgi:hypothetical protein
MFIAYILLHPLSENLKIVKLIFFSVNSATIFSTDMVLIVKCQRAVILQWSVENAVASWQSGSKQTSQASVAEPEERGKTASVPSSCDIPFLSLFSRLHVRRIHRRRSLIMWIESTFGFDNCKGDMEQFPGTRTASDFHRLACFSQMVIECFDHRIKSRCGQGGKI